MRDTTKGDVMGESYTVYNIYGINGESRHRTPEAALRECDRRERDGGEGWVVADEHGARYVRDWDGHIIAMED